MYLSRKITLLATSRALLKKENDEYHTVRLLIDQGSELPFISEELVQRAKLKRSASSIPLLGIDGTYSEHTKRIVSYNYTLYMILPTNALSTLTYCHGWQLRYRLMIPALIPGLILLDFDSLIPTSLHPDLFQIIIGSDNYGSVILPGLIQGQPSTPLAQKTIFGWVLSGTFSTDGMTLPAQAHHCTPDHELQELIARFWTQEELPASTIPKLNKDEEECERHFMSIHTRDETGRYVVRLPLKSDPKFLRDSKATALKIFNRLSKKFSFNPKFKQLYTDFMGEYKSMSHMVAADIAENGSPTVYYLPHLEVFRETSRITKLRVVFNGSSRTSNGLSLNAILYTGAKLQKDISEILLWSRTHRILFTTDIEKMFWQIAVHRDDWDLQRVLWYGSEGQPEAYRLTTMTYGINCASFLAFRTIQQLVSDEGGHFPKATTPRSKEDMWMTSSEKQIQHRKRGKLCDS